MSFESLETTFSPLKIEFPKVSESSVESSVLSGDFKSIKTLLAGNQTACENAAQMAYQTAIQAMRLQAHEYIIRMLEQAILARQRMFGASSEQLSAQSRLFDEAEALAQSSAAAQDLAPIPAEVLPPALDAGTSKPAVKPARGKRAPLPAQLERVDVVHDVPEGERTCPCGTPMLEIGCDVSEQLDIVPLQVRVLRHLRKRYACPDSLHAPVTAALPPQPLPKSNASADFLAMLLAVKFVDGLPLARFEHVLARHAVPVPRQTLARWVICCSHLLQPLPKSNASADFLAMLIAVKFVDGLPLARFAHVLARHAVPVPRQTLACWVIGCSHLLQPLHNLMRDILLDGSLLYMDETVVLGVQGERPLAHIAKLHVGADRRAAGQAGGSVRLRSESQCQGTRAPAGGLQRLFDDRWLRWLLRNRAHPGD